MQSVVDPSEYYDIDREFKCIDRAIIVSDDPEKDQKIGIQNKLDS